jgi:aspartyl-tRNA(Asn)/glutamyl-tRNA(Gln) amidotransferase subunit B
VELLGKLNADGRGIEASPVSPEALAELVTMVEAGEVSGPSAKAIFAELHAQAPAAPSLGPRAIAERDGHRQVSDISVIEAAVREVLTANPEQVRNFRAGKTKVRGFLVGQVMKQTRGRANPQLVGEVLDRLLAES